MSLPKKISVTEVCPRDGWQNFKTFIPTEKKIEYIKRMIDNGAKHVEITSYVHPKWVPQMADADEVTRELLAYSAGRGALVSALTLNSRGVARARSLGMKNLGFVISVSSEHNRRNSNKSTEDVLADFEAMAEGCEDLNIVLNTACSFGSPFGEDIKPDDILRIYDVAVKHGIYDIGLADSAGVSTPDHTRSILRGLIPKIGLEHIIVHLHDTRGTGLANAFVAMDEGVTRFESSLGAMGGCPYIPGAKGNIGTEDLIWMAESMGIDTGMDLESTVALALEMTSSLGAPVVSSQSALAAAAGKCNV